MATALAAQTGADTIPSHPITTGGVGRVAATIDSVFLDHQRPEAVADPGDFTAYLLARLGVTVLPPDLLLGVTVDDSVLRIGGRIRDLPLVVRQQLSPLILLFPSDTRIEGLVSLARAGPDGVRFHLQGLSLGGIALPEMMLGPVFRDIGRRYPALTESGRDLLVALPPGSDLTLVPEGLRIRAP